MATLEFVRGRMTVAGTTIDRAELVWWGKQDDDRAGAGWSIDVPTLLAMLQAGSADEVQAALLAGLEALVPHGCCYTCEGNVDAYEQALQKYQRTMAEMFENAEAMTAQSHPFLVTRNHSVHTWNCPAPVPLEMRHPGETLSEFTHSEHSDPWSGYQPTNGVRRLTAEELAEYIRGRRGPKGAANFKRCKRCQPALPLVYASAATG